MMDNSPKQNYVLSPGFVVQLTEAQPRLLGFLLKRLGNNEQARDVLQEVNMVLCGKAIEFEAGTDFMAWAFTIARFQLMAFRKKQVRDRLVFPEDLATKIDTLDFAVFPAESHDDRKKALQECMSKLIPEHQDLVVRRYAESISVKALATDLGRTPNAISCLVHRIRDQLIQCLNTKMSQGSAS